MNVKPFQQTGTPVEFAWKQAMNACVGLVSFLAAFLPVAYLSYLAWQLIPTGENEQHELEMLEDVEAPERHAREDVEAPERHASEAPGGHVHSIICRQVPLVATPTLRIEEAHVEFDIEKADGPSEPALEHSGAHH